MRVDPGLGFDNRQERPITGTAPWARRDVVLDVPPSATNLAFGLLLAGAGRASMSGVRVEVVGETVAVTGGKLR